MPPHLYFKVILTIWQMNIRKKLLILNVIILLISISVIIYIALSFVHFVYAPASKLGTIKYINVNRNESMKKLAVNLKKEGLIRRSDWFYYYIWITNKARKVKAGVHILKQNYTPSEVLKELIDASPHSFCAVIPEGFNSAMIADKLGKEGIDSSELLTLFHNRSFIHKITGFDAVALEGFLYPDTYCLYKGIGAEETVRLMVYNFHKVFYSISGDEIFNKDDYNRLIAASIIEKEASDKKEKPLIAAVIYNRLKKHMFLQMDSTLIYGIKDFDGDIKKADLKNKDNIYNTYTHMGLPPTPICNPGYDSIYAAFHPKKVDYLYFVSNGGRNIFSRTLKEHNKWVMKYQKKK